MSDARESILERIQSALGHGRGTAEDPAVRYAAISRTYIRAGRLDPETRLSVFKDRLRDYDAHVVDTSSALLSDTIDSILRSNKQMKIITADGLAPEALPQGFDFLPECEADINDLNNCDGVITTCSVAIAATGTIVLTHGPGEGARRLTLLPDRHLCIVRAEQIVETVPEAFDQLAQSPTHTLTFISGPSATADIEMTRVRGVHGPRFLDVVLVK